MTPVDYEWLYSDEHRQACRLLERQALWGQGVCRIWLPREDRVVLLSADRLRPLSEAPALDVHGLRYIAAAARVSEALAQPDVLLAPIESSVIPLPHQIRALSRAMAGDRVRYLLADEVGLGKTIEAGLVLRELKLRGRVRRALVIAPKGLVTQWVAEMRTHFGEEFRLLIPSDFSAYRRVADHDNVWRTWPQVVCPMDSVKPMDGRRGWSRQQVEEYNRERFEDLISAGWDLVIVDEAHRLGGSTDQVARYRLGQGLADAAPYVLLLSATPHQGKTDAFHRLVSLIDGQAFPDVGSVTRERVEPYVIRTEKRKAIAADGKPLFKPRRTELAPIRWQDHHQAQRALYEAVTEYVRLGYNQAVREKRSYIGFLMILMQRLVVSSTRAIGTTLERRLDALQVPQEQATLFPLEPEEWDELDGQEQIEALLKTRLTALKNERAEVELLLRAAQHCESAASDAKAEALLEWIYRLQAEEGESELKVLVFTEFVPTQQMLATFLTERGFSVTCLNGSMDMEERRRVQESFAQDTRILVSTDAGGEGLNLQFCHVVINYDIPWNPMRLEQRIGRVDRIGQDRAVRAINFVFEESVEFRVREVLEAKLAVIFEEFGIDKTGDVLDSAQAGQMFDELYVDAILNPDAIDTTVESVVDRIRREASDARRAANVLGDTGLRDPREAQRLMSHPLPHWVECMTVSYLLAHGGAAERSGPCWRLMWPDGEIWPEAVFTSREAAQRPTSRHINLEESRVRDLAQMLPRFAIGQSLAQISLSGLSEEIAGFWSLWCVTARVANRAWRRIAPVFLHDDGRSLPPTAKRVWEQLLNSTPRICRGLESTDVEPDVRAVYAAAEHAGQHLFREIEQQRHTVVDGERAKGQYAFAARRKAIERIGLSSVRDHRLAELAKEETAWRAQVDAGQAMLPDLYPLVIVRVEAGGSSD